MEKIFEEIINLKKKRTSFAVATIVESTGSTPRKIGSKMIVKQDGTISGTIGGGPLEHTVIMEAQKILKDGKAKKLSFELADLKLTCGGNVEVFVEPFLARERVLIFGAGHIGQCLAPLLLKCGFGVTVIDSRQKYLENQIFDDCDKINVKGYEVTQLNEHAAELKLTGEDYIVIVTHGHEYSDGKVLNFALEQLKEFKYMGMIGSANKVATCMNGLMQKGFTEETLKKVYAPIGLDTGGETPDEIAVAITAEILKEKYSRTGLNVKNKKGFFASKS
ncbi:MAG: XdhC/CoxI family protein [Candidatus Wallbacteria bacterium]